MHQHRKKQGNSLGAFALMAVAIAAAFALFHVWTTGNKPKPPVAVVIEQGLPPDAVVPINPPDPSGCSTCEAPTSQPSTVTNPPQIVQGECTPLVNCQPSDNVAPKPKPTGDVQTSPPGQYQPYQKPEHNPLVPHKEWGLPKN